jgi:hypothetical protein
MLDKNVLQEASLRNSSSSSSSLATNLNLSQQKLLRPILGNTNKNKAAYKEIKIAKTIRNGRGDILSKSDIYPSFKSNLKPLVLKEDVNKTFYKEDKTSNNVTLMNYLNDMNRSRPSSPSINKTREGNVSRSFLHSEDYTDGYRHLKEILSTEKIRSRTSSMSNVVDYESPVIIHSDSIDDDNIVIPSHSIDDVVYSN